MAKRKVGDRVEVKDKYFNPFNEMIGTITSIDDYYHIIGVTLDEEWGIDGEKEFRKEELIGLKK